MKSQKKPNPSKKGLETKANPSPTSGKTRKLGQNESDKKGNSSPKKVVKKNEHYQKFSEKIFKNDKDKYMEKFIVASKDKFMATCKLCDPMSQEPFLAQQVFNHIFTKTHYQNTPENERDKELKDLKDYLNQAKQEPKRLTWSNKSKIQRDEEETKEFLEFIAYCLSERLSFLQTSKIGNFFKEVMNRLEGSKLNFFRHIFLIKI